MLTKRSIKYLFQVFGVYWLSMFFWVALNELGSYDLIKTSEGKEATSGSEEKKQGIGNKILNIFK